MSLSVTERGRAVATFRAIEVRLMEMAAAWVPTTPEMEVKVLLGTHLWDFAQHADALGKRTFELRLPEQHSVPPAESYRAVLDDAAGRSATADRLAALYDVVLPGLERRYRWYLSSTHEVLDAPTRAIVERILADVQRQKAQAADLRRDLGLPSASTPLVHDDGGTDGSFVAPAP